MNNEETTKEVTPNSEEKTTVSTNTDTNVPVQEDVKISPKAPVEEQLTAAPTKKLEEILPEKGTNLLYISGTLAGHDYDCEGPIEFPFKLDKPMWPLTPIKPNSEYENQRFDYDSGNWIATDAKSQGQQITDLGKKVEALQEDSANHEKSADQTQQMGMQLTKTMALLATKFSTMEGKLDTLLNAKDGDK